LPDESGFSLLEYYSERKFEIVVTTAYPKYAVDSIKIEAFDFIIKPIKSDDLKKTIDRFKKRKTTLSEYKIKTCIDNLENDIEINKKVLFPSKNKYHIEKINNILYCKADINYCYIYTLTKNPYLITTTLKHLENLLPKNKFFRTHKSYLVNLNHILSFDKKEMKLVLENNQTVNVAHRRADELLRRLYG
jgi:two-component system LytT family response regulator